MSTTIDGVPIASMPDLGVVTDASSFVAEKSGSGRLTAPALANYVTGKITIVSNLLSVKDFGAKGDGTTDDTAAINSMIASVPSGASVYWPTGTYKVSSLITVGKQMTWVGAGRLSTTVATNQAAASVFVFNACVNITDMGFTCSATPTSGVMLTYNTGAIRSRLTGFWMVNFFSGITVNGTSDLMFIDGQMFNWRPGGTGILYIGGEAMVMDNLIMQQGTRPGNGNGIVVQNGGIQLINSEIMACGTCLALAPGSGQAVVSMWVCNTGFDNAVNGIVFEPTGTGAVARNWFIGCWISSMDQSGVTMISPALSSVYGVEFNSCHVFGNALHGFNLVDNRSTCVSWLNCQISGNTDTGISMFAGAQNFSIIGCRIGAYGEYGNNGTGGINLGGSCTYYRITDNDLNNGGISPLYGAGVQGGTNPGINEFIYGNIGYVAQNRGQATIPAGQLSVTVAHGLSGAPRLQDIFLTNLTGEGNPPAAAPFVLSPNASTFVIEIGVSLAFNMGVSWKAVLPCSF